MKRLVKKIWHYLFYVVTLGLGLRFGLNCREAVKRIDLSAPGVTGMDRFRFKLHLSLCEYCTNYRNGCLAIQAAAKDFFLKRDVNSLELKKLNHELLGKFSIQK